MPLASIQAHWLAGWEQTGATPSPLHHGLPLHHPRRQTKKRRKQKLVLVDGSPILLMDNGVWVDDTKLKVLNIFMVTEDY